MMAGPSQQMLFTGTQKMALNLLSAMKLKMEAKLVIEGTLTFCRAYALDPRLATRSLVSMSRDVVQKVLSTLEDWCGRQGNFGSVTDHVISNDVLRDSHVTLTWEQVSDIILSPGLAPNNYPALSLKAKYQMQEERYGELMTTCTRALRACVDERAERHVFWIPRGLAYIMLQDFESGVKDYLCAYKENPSACQTFVAAYQSGYVGTILRAFYFALETRDQGGACAKSGDVSELLEFILGFERDPRACLVHAKIAMEKCNLNDVTKFLSSAIQRLGEHSMTSEYMELCFMRGKCHIAMGEIDKALADYVTTMTSGEELTRASFDALTRDQQSTLAARAKHVASELLAGCQQVSTSKVSGSAQLPQKNLTHALNCYTLALFSNGEDVDILFSMAECHKLLGNFTKAIDLFTKFLAVHPTYEDALCNRAACYLECGDAVRALDDYNASLALHPHSVQSLCGRAWLSLRQGKPSNAASDIIAASKVSLTLCACWVRTLPEEEKVDMRAKLRDHVAVAMETRRPTIDKELTLEVAGVLTRVWPDDVASHKLYADMLIALERPDEAKAYLDNATLKKLPDQLTLTVHRVALCTQDGQWHSAVEELALAAGKYSEDSLKRVLTELKDFQRIRLGREAHKEGKRRARVDPNDPAIEMLLTVAVVAAQGSGWDYHLSRAKLRWWRGDAHGAYKDCLAALTVKKDSCELWCFCGIVLFHFKKVNDANKHWVKAAVVDDEALKSLVASLPEKEKRWVMDGLENSVQQLFHAYVKGQATLPMCLMICHLLVRLDGDSFIYHSDFADALICNKDYNRAAEELAEAGRICPENLSMLCRRSHVHSILGNVNACVLDLCRIAELEPKALETTMRLFNQGQKQRILYRSYAHARAQGDEKAAMYYTICIAASNGEDHRALRMRAQCLGRLLRYEFAIGDITAVINSGLVQAEDLCFRANLHLQDENPRAALNDYIVAMEMDSDPAGHVIEQFAASKESVCREFVALATEEIEERNIQNAVKLCRYGLQVDPTNVGLQQLRTQLERSKTKCVVQ